MALGDQGFSSSHLNHQRQAILAANPLPHYNLLQNNFGGLAKSLSGDGCVGMDQSDSSVTNGRLRSVSPSPSTQSHKEKSR